jgi:hypothetical protein
LSLGDPTCRPTLSSSPRSCSPSPSASRRNAARLYAQSPTLPSSTAGTWPLQALSHPGVTSSQTAR